MTIEAFVLLPEIFKTVRLKCEKEELAHYYQNQDCSVVKIELIVLFVLRTMNHFSMAKCVHSTLKNHWRRPWHTLSVFTGIPALEHQGGVLITVRGKS